MFRRPGKNPLEKETPSPLYKEESTATPYAKFAAKKSDYQDATPRLFDVPSPAEENWTPDSSSLPHHFPGAVKEEAPETTLGEGVTFRGELSFERLLRIDGTFEGELLSQGKVIVGPKGKVKANLNLREAIIEGEVRGNITVQEHLELRGEATVYGDISAKTFSVDEGVTLVGHVRVNTKDSPAPDL